MIFDIVASEYGYTLSQFSALTPCVLFIALDRIARRNHNAFACRAALMGVKIPFKKTPGHKVESDASPETKEFTQLAMSAAIKRKAEEFARRK